MLLAVVAMVVMVVVVMVMMAVSAVAEQERRRWLCGGVPFVVDRLVGLVVKASASRAEDPGFESRLRRDFFVVESYQ